MCLLTCTLTSIEQPLLSSPVLLTRLMLGKYSWNFLIIQLERAAGQPGLVIVCGGNTETTPLQTDISLGLSATHFRGSH